MFMNIEQPMKNKHFHEMLKRGLNRKPNGVDLQSAISNTIIG